MCAAGLAREMQEEDIERQIEMLHERDEDLDKQLTEIDELSLQAASE